MKRNKRSTLTAYLLFALVAGSMFSMGCERETGSGAGCAEANVSFDISSLEKIRRTPDSVLADVREFWETEPPYIAAKRWEPTGYPIHYGEFERIVGELAVQNEQTRSLNDCFALANGIHDAAPQFRARGLSGVCSYLPEETVLEASVLLACFIHLGDPDPRFSPSAFVVEDDIVVNASSTFWNSNVNDVLHMLIHEVYHVGYHAHHRSLPLQDAETGQEMVEHILWQLQNEGMATYVAYKARSAFPESGDEEDYRLLEDPEQVELRLDDVRDLIEQAVTVPPAEMRDAVIERGITNRGFYIVGAHMARTIEEVLGRDALVTAVRDGPAAFSELYDSLVEEGEEIRP
jgi:hypothetical protein